MGKELGGGDTEKSGGHKRGREKRTGKMRGEQDKRENK
jgi:hypothetical protein